MPDNEEIERALSLYRDLYRPGQHAPILAELRRQALELMRHLKHFNPYLVGPVLSGIAGKHSAIELHLFANSTKEFELFLLNQNIRYKSMQVRLFLNDSEQLVPAYSFEYVTTEIRVIALDARDLRHPLKTSLTGRPVERASISMVELLSLQK